MSSPIVYNTAFAKGIKNSKIAPLGKNAPLAPQCPKDLVEPSTSKMAPMRPGKDTGCGYVATSAFLEEKLSGEVRQYECKEIQEHQAALEKTEKAVKALLKEKIPGIKIWTTGSLPAGVVLHSSDLDMTVKLPGMEGTQRQKLFNVKRILEGLPEFKKVWVQVARVPVLQLVFAETNMEIDVTVDNDDGKRNTQILAWYGQIDARVSLLCKAVKGWASSVGVEGARLARLNSFTLCLMVIQYLQVAVSPAILPCLQDHFPELKEDMEVEDDDYQKRNLKKELEAKGYRIERNESSVGSLFAGFLKFYAEFDFQTNWISVRSGKVMKKRWDEKEEPMDGMPQCSRGIVVQDPFIEPSWNCAGSAWDSGTTERLCLEFQLSFDRLIESRSIFGGSLTSVARQMIDSNGKQRDLQPEMWRKEILDARVKRGMEMMAVEADWDVVEVEEEGKQEEEVDDGWWVPFDGLMHPMEFWDKQDKESTLLPWPEPAMRMRFE